MGALVDRIPIKIWQRILLLAIESDGSALFTTTRTPPTFIHLLKREGTPDNLYTGYARCRATLRQVCRAWGQFLLSTDSSWIHVDGTRPPFHYKSSAHHKTIVNDHCRPRIFTVWVLTEPSTSCEGCRYPSYSTMSAFIYLSTPILFSTPLILSLRLVPMWHFAASGSLVYLAVYLMPSHFLNSIPTLRVSFLYPLSIWSCTPRKSSHSAPHLTSIRHSISYGDMIRNLKAYL